MDVSNDYVYCVINGERSIDLYEKCARDGIVCNNIEESHPGTF